MRRKVSIVVPVYNEGHTVKRAFTAIAAVCDSQLPEHEIIFVDDGSTDDSFSHLEEMCRVHRHVRAIKLAANCGAHMAIRAGLEHATGDVAAFLACDLQEPPALIPEMLAALREPVEVVWAVRADRDDPWTTKLFSRAFYRLARTFATKNVPPGGASAFLLGSRALKAVRAYRERNLTLEGMFATMGFPSAHITYQREARREGASKWTLAKRLKLFSDFFVGYSFAPIRLMSWLGIVVALLGLGYAVFLILNRVFLSNPIEGWSSLMVTVLVTSGIQMVLTGIMGEYLWRTLDEVRARPRYIIERMLSSADGGDPPEARDARQRQMQTQPQLEQPSTPAPENTLERPDGGAS
jgi:polyisoprenyl-phosphate glycosyltransferase